MRHRHRERDEERAHRSPLRWTDRLIEAGVLFLIVFTPLAFGTVEPWSEAIAEVVVLGMVVTWAVGMLADWELRIELPPGWLPAALFLVLAFLQAVPLPHGLIALVSPWATSFYDSAAAYAAGTAMGFTPISLAAHSTWREALKLGAVAAFFLVSYNVYRTRAQVHRAIWTMIIMGTIISIFGIVQRVTWNGRFYWMGPEAPHASAFGPFVNRAHFAGLIVVVVPMALALLLAGGQDGGHRRTAHGLTGRLRRWNSDEAGPTRLIPFLILLMGGAALVAGSRGGVVALVASLLVMVGLGAQGRSGGGSAVRVAIATVLIILAGMWIGGDVLYGTVTRLAEEVGRPDEGARARIWADALDLWAVTAAAGTGLGTFEVVYPEVRTVRAPAVFTHAESDWVQLLTDTGIAGLGLTLATGACLVLSLVRRFRQAESRWAQTLVLAAVVALVGTAVQGIGNFNLPVLSGLVYLAMLLALALRASAAPVGARA